LLGLGLLAAGLLFGATACGGSGSAPGTASGSGDEEVSAPSWAAPLLARPGPEATAVLAGSDYAVGKERVSFLLVRPDNSLVRAPVADVFYRPQASGTTRRSVARLVPIGVRPGEEAAGGITDIYVATLDLTRPGKQWIVVQPRGTRFQGFQIVDVKAKPTAVAVGEEAPASANPTVASRSAASITTADPPDVPLLRHSVAESLRAHVPFVVAFATPAFCKTRTCGPTLEVMEAVRTRYERRGIRFIHIEIYEDNLPGNGVNRWVREWRLPSEPWIYVVDDRGVVRDRFEGAVSVGELTASVRRDLLDS
jgi:hypothetical protein